MKHPGKHTSAGADVFSVRIDRIGEEGHHLDEVVTPAWLANTLGRNSPYRPGGEGRVHLDLHLVEDVVHVRGRVRVAVVAQCSRCLTEVPMALDTPVEVALFPRGAEPPAAPDGELGEEDLGVATYEEGEVDLASVVHDEVFLELPMNPLCDEQCKGLCPSCGINLNEGVCSCAPATDPRWQALAGIKLS